MRVPFVPLRLRNAYRPGLFLALLAFMVVAASLLVLLSLQYERDSGSNQEVPVAMEELSVKALPESLPVRLRIPKLSIDTTFVAPLGLAESGEIEVPDSNTEVGWYQYGPTPGELGPAVIVGHVDSYIGPAVFFYLGQLDLGDDIYIDRADGTTAHFVVEELERPKQSSFPTARVYGDIDHAGLRLITCSGIYERGKQRYTHNLIVYARLAE